MSCVKAAGTHSLFLLPSFRCLLLMHILPAFCACVSTLTQDVFQVVLRRLFIHDELLRDERASGGDILIDALALCME